MTITAEWELDYDGFAFGADNPFGILSVDGLDPPDSREDVTTRAGGHGAFVFAGYLAERRIVITGDVLADPSNFTAIEDEWRRVFGPRTSPSQLKFRRWGSEIRYVNAVTTRRKLPWDNLYSLGYATWTVEMIAGDPRIYSETSNNRVISPAAESVSGVDFSIDFSVNFGGGASGTTQIVNNGSFPAPPVMRIDGPVATPSVQNLTTGEYVKLNFEIPDGSFMLLDFLNKTVLLDGTATRYFSLDPGSRWWHLQPGANDLLYTGFATDAGSTLTITWRDTWL